MLSNLSLLYFDEGRYGEAAHLLRRALVLESRLAIKHGTFSDTYRKLGLPNEAAEECRRAATLTAEQLSVDGRDATALARHAVFLAKLGEPTRALHAIRRAVDLAPDDHTVLYKRAVVHALLKQRVAAVDQQVALGRSADAAGVGRRRPPGTPAPAVT
jgi:tetratricopeptide (TPR) repeat protein